jgi:aspartate racemase
MKTIGLIGGMSWESSTLYYQIINQKIKGSLGGLHSAKCILFSGDFQEIADLQHQGKWEELSQKMVSTALSLQNAGADCVVLCTNTMHKLAQGMKDALDIPFLHIVDATAEELKANNISKVGLLGTKFTMEQDFLKKDFLDKYGVETLIPLEEEREMIHHIIYNELVKGIITEESRQTYLEIIEGLVLRGAEAIVLACTEIGLLIKQENTPHKIFDTTYIHAEKAAQWSIHSD